MITTEHAELTLRIISQAWGPADNTGYCFFPWVEGPNRQFRTKSFKWPEQRDDIVQHLINHEDDDLYWCPVIFSEDARRVEFAKEEYALWADLDESDPRKIKDQWRPSVAWETSPGRFQALWLLEDHDEEDLYGASKRGADNHRMTVMVDADPSGWDTTQLLRLPGWVNHKPQYLGADGYPEGQLLWQDGPRYQGQDFNKLPEVLLDDDESTDEESLPDQLEGIDVGEVLDRVGHKMSPAVLEKFNNGPTGEEDRSAAAFYLMRCFADAGCSVAEIVAIIQRTRWNKFKGRPTELQDLGRQATIAWNKRKRDEAETVTYEGVNIKDFIAQVKQPRWLVKDMLVRGSVGFIAGDPKSRKSWVALDLALSVAGSASSHKMDFLGQFEIRQPGPVLYFVLEDGDHLIKTRALKIWEEKTKYDGTRFAMENGQAISTPKNGHIEAPLVIVHQQRMNLADASFVALLQARIRKGHTYDDGSKASFALVVIDTLMRSVGTTDINHMGEMTNGVLEPLARMAKRHKTTMLLVHHFNKSQREGETRGGTRLLGSQALHAWAEDSLYLTAGEHSFGLELESKTAPAGHWDFVTDPTQRTWSPRLKGDTATVKSLDFAGVDKPPNKTLTVLENLPPGLHTTREIITASGQPWSTGYTHRSLTGLVERGKVVKDGTRWRLA